jgi:hypothetical protein
MTTIEFSFEKLSDSELLTMVTRLTEQERCATAQLIASLMELDTRRLYLAEGCASLFTYCTQVLHLSEHAAYGRIEAARAARRYPILLTLLADGALTLTAVGLLAPHLTAENHREVLAAARHKSKRDVEQLVARLHPRADVPALIRKLPERAPSPSTWVSKAGRSESASEAPPTVPPPPSTPRPTVVSPLTTERYKVQFTVGRDTHGKLRQAQALLRHQIPNGDPAVIFDRALTILLERLENTKLATVTGPRAARPAAKSSRHIPAAVKREVWARDGGRCAFVGRQGRCTETAFLEFHHVVPYAAGGETSTANVALRCRSHNAYEAECYFSPGHPHG